MRISPKEVKEQLEIRSEYPKILAIVNKTNKSIFDIHHVIPVSLNWDDGEHNKVWLWRPVHIYNHKEQNIPMREYSQLLRERRIETNDKLLKTKQYLEKSYKMQKRYFRWVDNLPSPLLDIHNYKMYEYMNHYELICIKMWINIDKYADDISFQEKHQRLHDLLVFISNDMRKTLSKKYYNL